MNRMGPGDEEQIDDPPKPDLGIGDIDENGSVVEYDESYDGHGQGGQGAEGNW